MTIKAVDLFCGAGGLTHGFVLEGVPVVAGIDIDPACRHPYEVNNGAKFIEKNIVLLTGEDLSRFFGSSEIRILAGCAPCQPFSTYAQRYDVVGSARWMLLYQFGRLVSEATPDIVAMENVPSVCDHVVFHDFVLGLKGLGYKVWFDVLNCADFGLPQNRRRLVLLASRHGLIEICAPSKARAKTVRDAIGSLPPIAAGDRLDVDPLHTSSRLSELNLERIRVSRPGGTWRDWPAHLMADCHRRASGKTFPGVYGRMLWDEPAPTLTTQFYGFGNGRFGHPEQDRALSLREGAILQGFPEHYSFVPDGAPIHFKSLGRMIGNAVPVTLGRIIGRSILRHLAVAPEKKAVAEAAQSVAERKRYAKREPLVA